MDSADLYLYAGEGYAALPRVNGFLPNIYDGSRDRYSNVVSGERWKDPQEQTCRSETNIRTNKNIH